MGKTHGTYENAADNPRKDSATILGTLYAPINRWQTRIVILYPGSDDDPLVAKLVVADIVDLPGVVLHDRQQFVRYEAVSYAWGQPIFDHQIRINNQDVPITRTLYEALRHFRPTIHPRPLWVDALSICQAHAKEKSFQVQNMFTIFRKALVVLVWLGEASEHTEEAVKILQHGSNWVNPTSFGPPLSPSARSGMLDLCSRAWISRAWIQQEVFASQNIAVYCGEHCMTLKQFKEVARTAGSLDHQQDSRIKRNLTIFPHLRQATEADLNRLGEQRCLQHKGICRHIRSSGSTTPQLRGAVTCTRPECVIADLKGVLASEPQDRVYALLARMDCRTSYHGDLVTPDEPFIPIDYNLSISQVFQCLTKCLMNRDGALDILALHEKSGAKELHLPSWTPDWQNWEWHRGDLERNHRAHDHMSFPRERLQWQNYDDWDTLKIKGRIIGTFNARFGEVLQLIDQEPSSVDDKPMVAYFRDVGGHPGLRTTGPVPVEEALEAIARFEAGEGPWNTGSRVREGDLLIQSPGEIRPLMIVLRKRKKGDYKFVESIASLINAETWETFRREAEFGHPREFVVW